MKELSRGARFQLARRQRWSYVMWFKPRFLRSFANLRRAMDNWNNRARVS